MNAPVSIIRRVSVGRQHSAGFLQVTDTIWLFSTLAMIFDHIDFPLNFTECKKLKVEHTYILRNS